MSLDANSIKQLADEVLTFIEQREAEQIAYGIYDVTMTGAEVINDFEPSEDFRLSLEERTQALTELSLEEKTEALTEALKLLGNDLQIICFNKSESPIKWIFRSRIAEIVRLLTKLRQRIVRHNPEKEKHRISNSKRLVADVKFSVASRRVPRRNIQADRCMAPLINGTKEQQQTGSLLLEVIINKLSKLRNMSGFQLRTLHRILEAIELDSQQGIEKGVVVTASTGAGKTYAFFLPVLAKMVLERCLRGREGVKAICIYPRVALSENQLTDFIEVLFYLNQVLLQHNLPTLTIGLESGAAVYQTKDFQVTSDEWKQKLAKMRGWTFSEEYAGYLSPFAYCVGTEDKACKEDKQRLLVRPTQPQTLVCPVCDKQYPFIRFARDVMAEHPPDLLIATTESLHRRLLSSKYQYLFGTGKFSAPSVVMLDEIHLQTSTAGTQVALLLRRLMARIRMGKQHRNEQANLAFVGLSATIAEPIQFLSDLSGIPVTRIRHVSPKDEEMQTVGAERYIFVRAEDTEDTAVISTLIQTAMCVLHNMPQPLADSDLKRYRTFGFVQSLDIVGRWLYQMEDAEKVKPEQKEKRKRYKNESIENRPIDVIPLYAYRFPPYNRELFPKFFGSNVNCNCNCESNDQPDLNCPFFQAGECWWVLSQQGKARREPLNIKRKSGSDRSIVIDVDDDLIITTTALEVGYDDEALMCVLQYTAPANVASFVQRKGRGGRKVGTRPIVVTVLSPYKSTDLFLFRNEHLLTDPTFQKLPLNSQNRYLQRIHGFYTLFDWLAYRASCMGINLDLDYLSRQGYDYLMQQTADLGVLIEFKDYLKVTFAIPDDAIIQVLGDESEGFLLRIFYQGLMQAVNNHFEQNSSDVKARDFLYKYLPENLFSDINLPEVRVDYRPDNNYPNKQFKPESISLAISETIPGNVTFRGGEGSTWIPPEILEGEPSLIPISQYYQFTRIDERPNTVNLPIRALRKVDITPRSTHSLDLYRPTEIKPKQFSKDHNSSFWRCNPKTGELSECRDYEKAAQDTQPLAHSCSANPISAVDIRAVRGDTPTPAYTLTPNHLSLTCDTLGKALLERVVLYSDEPANLNLLDVRRIILGSQYIIKFHNSLSEEIRGVFGFRADEDSLTNCALGYQMLTEGVSFDLSPNLLAALDLSASTQANLCYNAIRHAFVTTLTVDYAENYFAAENLADIILTVAARWCNGESGTLDGLYEWFSSGNHQFECLLTEAVNDIHQLSRKNQQAVRQLVDDDNNYLTIFLDLYAEIQSGGLRYQQYLRDCFQYSLTQALKSVAQEVAGVEALNYVAAWTELHADFEGRAANRIWLYEIGIGGIGVMRATHDLLRKHPDRFWTVLADKMTSCSTASEEAFLRHLLAQPIEWLEECGDLVNVVTATGSSSDRQTAIQELLARVRRQLGTPVRQAQLKSLLRVFIPDYTQEIDGSLLVNWRIFREINHEFLPRCTQQLGRDPTFTEARAMLYREIVKARQNQLQSPYPESERLLKLYEAEYGSSADEARKVFEAAAERRMLLNCRCNCSSCLDDRSGDIEAPGLSRNLLNRPLLTEWLNQVRAQETLELNSTNNGADVCEKMRLLLEDGSQAIYLRVRSDRLASLCTAISYLTDAGIDTDIGTIYPMITDIQTVYSNDLNSTEPPLIEVTVRPIK